MRQKLQNKVGLFTVYFIYTYKSIFPRLLESSAQMTIVSSHDKHRYRKNGFVHYYRAAVKYVITETSG